MGRCGVDVISATHNQRLKALYTFLICALKVQTQEHRKCSLVTLKSYHLSRAKCQVESQNVSYMISAFKDNLIASDSLQRHKMNFNTCNLQDKTHHYSSFQGTMRQKSKIKIQLKKMKGASALFQCYLQYFSFKTLSISAFAKNLPLPGAPGWNRKCLSGSVIFPRI